MKRATRGDSANRMSAVRALHKGPEPDLGYGPVWEAVLAGRREFAGRVLGEPWYGHDVLILVHGKPRPGQDPQTRELQPFGRLLAGR